MVINNRLISCLLIGSMLWINSRACLISESVCQQRVVPPCHSSKDTGHSKSHCCEGAHLAAANLPSFERVSSPAKLFSSIASDFISAWTPILVPMGVPSSPGQFVYESPPLGYSPNRSPPVC